MTTSTTSALAEAIRQNTGFEVTQNEDVLIIKNDDGIDAYLYQGESQIIVESILFELDQVTDAASLNELVLKTHKMAPLTTVGISEIQGKPVYVAFGALSVDSKMEVVSEEISTLFANVGDFIELYSEYLVKGEAA